MNVTKQQAISLLTNNPYLLGHLVGFKDLNQLNNEWIKELVRNPTDKTIQAHRNSYKTTCVSLAIVVIMILMPRKRIAFIRKTDTDVKEIIEQVEKILRSQVVRLIVRAIYGIELLILEASQTKINTNLVSDIKGTAQLTGFGIGASVTGKHYDIIFTDDIVNVTDRVSRAERERTKLFYQELQNIKNRGGWINNTGTPWHKEDAFLLMPAPQKFDCYTTGIMSAEDIAEKKRNMTASLFAANYELKHIADDDVMFTEPVTNADPALVLNGTSQLDAAYYGEDYTAFTIVGIHDGKFYVFGKCWRRHVDDVMDNIVALHKEYLCGKLYTETNADKGYSAKELKKRDVRVVTYHEDMNKHLKISTYLKGAWSNVVFVEGTDEEYINQICDYNENAEHDDCPDSLASLIRKLKKKCERREEAKEYYSVTGI